MKTDLKTRFALCVDNADFPAGLELRKIYRLKTDKQAASRGLIRVYDESQEDYLYPAHLFVEVGVSSDLQKILNRKN